MNQMFLANPELQDQINFSDDEENDDFDKRNSTNKNKLKDT